MSWFVSSYMCLFILAPHVLQPQTCSLSAKRGLHACNGGGGEGVGVPVAVSVVNEKY